MMSPGGGQFRTHSRNLSGLAVTQCLRASGGNLCYFKDGFEPVLDLKETFHSQALGLVKMEYAFETETSKSDKGRKLVETWLLAESGFKN